MSYHENILEEMHEIHYFAVDRHKLPVWDTNTCTVAVLFFNNQHWKQQVKSPVRIATPYCQDAVSGEASEAYILGTWFSDLNMKFGV